MFAWVKRRKAAMILEEMTAVRRELEATKRQISELETLFCRELEAIGGKIACNTVKTTEAMQQQIAQLERCVEDLRQSQARDTEALMERADEASRFYDQVALFIRKLPMLARTSEQHQVSSQERNKQTAMTDEIR